MVIKDKDTGTVFDDWTPNDVPIGSSHWTQVCETCAKDNKLLDSYLAIDEGSGICGVQGCTNEADHYYDFDGEEQDGEEEQERTTARPSPEGVGEAEVPELVESTGADTLGADKGVARPNAVTMHDDHHKDSIKEAVRNRELIGRFRLRMQALLSVMEDGRPADPRDGKKWDRAWLKAEALMKETVGDG